MNTDLIVFENYKTNIHYNKESKTSLDKNMLQDLYIVIFNSSIHLLYQRLDIPSPSIVDKMFLYQTSCIVFDSVYSLVSEKTDVFESLRNNSIFNTFIAIKNIGSCVLHEDEQFLSCVTDNVNVNIIDLSIIGIEYAFKKFLFSYYQDATNDYIKVTMFNILTTAAKPTIYNVLNVIESSLHPIYSSFITEYTDDNHW